MFYKGAFGRPCCFSRRSSGPSSGSFFIKLFGGIPIIAMHRDETIRIKRDQARAVNALCLVRLPATETELEIPGQHHARRVHHALAHEKPRPIKTLEHVAENRLHCGNPLYIVEGITKVAVRRIEPGKIDQRLRRQRFKIKRKRIDALLR